MGSASLRQQQDLDFVHVSLKDDYMREMRMHVHVCIFIYAKRSLVHVPITKTWSDVIEYWK